MRKKEAIQVFCILVIFLIEIISLLLLNDENYGRTITKSDIKITSEQKKIWNSLDSETKKELYEQYKNYYK